MLGSFIFLGLCSEEPAKTGESANNEELPTSIPSSENKIFPKNTMIAVNSQKNQQLPWKLQSLKKTIPAICES